MMQRILSCLFLILAVTVSCKDDEEIKTFNALVVVSDSKLVDDKYAMVTLYSTDGGQTFVDYPVVKPGDTYLVKVVDRTADGDVPIVLGNCFAIDWSGSNPVPTDPNAAVAEFVMQNDNALLGKVTDLSYAPFDASLWTGTFIGDEDGDCCSSHDTNVLRLDPSDPQKLIMDNFWGDGVDAYLVFAASTSKETQIVTIPEQTTSEGGIAKGTGTYDQCTKTFSLATSYEFGGDTYVFDYHFHRPE